MLRVTQGQTLKDDKTLRVAVPTDDYNESDLIECYPADGDPNSPTCMCQAQYAVLGNSVYQQSEELTEDQVNALLANIPAYEVINNRKLMDGKKPARKYEGKIIQRKNHRVKRELRKDLNEDQNQVDNKNTQSAVKENIDNSEEDILDNNSNSVQDTTSTTTPSVNEVNNTATTTPNVGMDNNLNDNQDILDGNNISTSTTSNTSTTTPNIIDNSTTTPTIGDTSSTTPSLDSDNTIQNINGLDDESVLSPEPAPLVSFAKKIAKKGIKNRLKL